MSRARGGSRREWGRAPANAPALALVAVALAAFAVASADVATRATLRATALARHPLAEWTADLGITPADLRPLATDATGRPFVEARVAGARLSLLLDTGLARGFTLTDRARRARVVVEGTRDELSADGTYRARSEVVRADSLVVLGATFLHATGARADWHLFAAAPFAGAVGLDFFLERRLTLDGRARRVAVSTAPLPAGLGERGYLVLDLVAPPARYGHRLYVRGTVAGRDALVDLDTGASESWVDPGFARDLERTDARERLTVVRRTVPLTLGGCGFTLDGVRERAIERGEGLAAPVALVLGSDVLSRLVVTVDLRARQLVLARAD